MVSGNLSFFLWLAAGSASVFMLLSAYSTLSWLWRLPERLPKRKGLMLSKPGDSELLREPPKKETVWIGVAKTLLLVAALLLAYDRGTKAEYSKEFAAWKVRQAQFEKEHAAWLARHSKEMTNGQSQQISLAR